MGISGHEASLSKGNAKTKALVNPYRVLDDL